ncbi:serine hydrolase domain-containing protein [Pseudonocardia alaniniphila]|uniref:Beta-lactamase family protein n=1 Tax=Pseudonocardia alaniniphila TaxID=75291 RepID=A0ABS9TMK4_9PSEU|nr:beta-lactamase family protein [Pseudonocardia alaniniphila]MCH6169743.1 beta-lactamase family protein [Pseudonocardia alaniniphila]
MTQHADGGPAAGTSYDGIWRVPDAQVASGRIPGYVGAVRVRGRVEVRAGGTMAVGPQSAAMDEHTLFRIASVTKPMGGALALALVEEGLLALDDPIARWLPEAANPRVLVAPHAQLHRTTEAQRPITVRHLLTMTSGWGAVFEETPLQAAMMERGVYPGPLPPPMTGDEFVARVADLPLAFQPGEGWLYDTGTDLLGVLLARAAGKPLSDLLAERITGPLGMTSTSFWTPDVHRLATAYRPEADGLEVFDPPSGAFASPPGFEKLSGGLLSTASDVLRFYCAMADGGAPVLSSASVALMTSDALTGAQRSQALPVLGPGVSWGMATSVDIEAVEPWMAPGRWGWDGGTGTTARVDPSRDTVGVLLTQRLMTGPLDGFDDFWAAVAAV